MNIQNQSVQPVQLFQKDGSMTQQDHTNSIRSCVRHLVHPDMIPNRDMLEDTLIKVQTKELHVFRDVLVKQLSNLQESTSSSHSKTAGTDIKELNCERIGADLAKIDENMLALDILNGRHGQPVAKGALRIPLVVGGAGGAPKKMASVSDVSASELEQKLSRLETEWGDAKQLLDEVKQDLPSLKKKVLDPNSWGSSSFDAKKERYQRMLKQKEDLPKEMSRLRKQIDETTKALRKLPQ